MPDCKTMLAICRLLRSASKPAVTCNTSLRAGPCHLVPPARSIADPPLGQDAKTPTRWPSRMLALLDSATQSIARGKL
jgi:hypothetical protein